MDRYKHKDRNGRGNRRGNGTGKQRMGRRWRDGNGTLSIPGGTPPGTTPVDNSPQPVDNGVTLAIPLEIAASYRARTRGLLGRDGVKGALLLTPATSVHTLRMRFPIDVAYLDRGLMVRSVRTMRPGRFGRPRLRSRHVVEAEAGAMERWGLRPGVRVTITTDAGPPGTPQAVAPPVAPPVTPPGPA